MKHAPLRGVRWRPADRIGTSAGPRSVIFVIVGLPTERGTLHPVCS